MLEETKNKLGWIKKRVELTDIQEDYIGFVLNEQQRLITLLSAHIYAARGCISVDKIEEAIHFLDEGVKDIEEENK